MVGPTKQSAKKSTKKSTERQTELDKKHGLRFCSAGSEHEHNKSRAVYPVRRNFAALFVLLF
jgi:hypothetical protein